MNAPNKSLLVVKCSRRMTDDQLIDIRQWIKPLTDKMGIEGVVIGDDLDVSVHHDLTPLVQAIGNQVAAINRLAASNEALVQAMAESEGVDTDDMAPRVGLNGRAL